MSAPAVPMPKTGQASIGPDQTELRAAIERRPERPNRPRPAIKRRPERSNRQLAHHAVLPLLKDFAERVNRDCERYLRTRLLVIFLLVVAGATDVTFLVRLWLLPEPSQLWQVVLGFFLAALTIGMGASVVVPTLRMMRHQLRSTANGLERVIRFASQFADHGVVDVGDRLALEVRLGDAEAALEQVRVVLKGAVRPAEISAIGARTAFEADSPAPPKSVSSPTPAVDGAAGAE